MNFGRHRTSRLTAADRRGWSIVPRTRLYRRSIAGAAAAMLVSVALLAQTSVTSEATWNDAEWVNSEVGTSACTPDAEGFSSRGEGRALSGSVLGTDLDAIAEAERVTVTNNGERVQATAGQPVQGIDSAFRDPLSVNVLSAIQAQLTGILELPADTNTGVVGQFGQAQTNGKSLGASGYVDNSGGIDLADEDTGEYPNLATLKLSELLDSDLLNLSDDQRTQVGSALSGIADVELEVGAVAGQASFDACESAWGGSGEGQAHTMAASTAEDIVAGLDRNYLAASADLSFTSDAVGELVSGVDGVIGGLDSAVNGLLTSTDLVSGILGGLTDLLGSLLDGLVNPTVAITEAKIDLNPVRELLTGTIGDSGGVLKIDLADGKIRVDTAALLARAYPESYSYGLNGLHPNSDLLSSKDGKILDALTAALTEAIGEWLMSIETALRGAVDGISIKATVQIKVSIIVTVTANVNANLADLRANKGVTASSSGLVGILLKPLVDGLINGLVGGLGGVIARTVDGLVLPLISDIPRQLGQLVSTVLSSVTGLYSGLFLSNIVSITVNAQNRPSSGGPPPLDWIAGETSAPPEGQYEVAALRIGVLDVLGANGVRLYLGRASVGPGCSPAATAQLESPCGKY